jgi:hypothetical protein
MKSWKGKKMKIEITKTDQTALVEGVPTRVWEGVTSDGVACKVYTVMVTCSLSYIQYFQDGGLQLLYPPLEAIMIPQDELYQEDQE